MQLSLFSNKELQLLIQLKIMPKLSKKHLMLWLTGSQPQVLKNTNMATLE